MTTLIKNLMLLLLFSCTLGLAQNKKVDSLIQQLSNKEAYIVLTQTTSPRISGYTANRIVKIGKTASPELVKILDSQNKGIIAHFILCEIWKNTWKEEVCFAISNVGGSEILTINGLEIKIENNVLYSTTENLKKNQQVWKKNCHV
jgi:hypothetical protein